jgi:hypothetical protein
MLLQLTYPSLNIPETLIPTEARGRLDPPTGTKVTRFPYTLGLYYLFWVAGELWEVSYLKKYF